jgi:hypothetical protein
LSDAHPQNLKVLIEVLKRYATLTGLTINSAKSVLIPIAIPTTHWEVVQGIMGCPIKHPLIKYLGLPLSVKKSTKLDYLSLLQKVQGRFRGSIGKWLSKGGRLTLINATINALPLHYMQAFKLPTWLIKYIERVKMRFLWKGEDRAANGHCLVL